MTRLDRLLTERGLFASRERAQRAIKAGGVLVEGRSVARPATQVSADARVEVVGEAEPFVSRGGRKLAAALDRFALDPAGWTCLDVGASTGGFTDCLLQRGARRIYAVDVGRDQLAEALRRDPRVVALEGVNARQLEAGFLPEPCRLVTADLSFISLRLVVPAMLSLLEPAGFLLLLVKPQFEVGRGGLGKGGILRDEEVRERTVENTVRSLEELGLERLGLIDSALPGAGGNRESFVWLRGPE
ncbi:MAG: TlyA family RNA methyltransferase [Acidobacteriota bacterium]